ncbi:hypothetical protein Tco_0012434 [Tanacetum coccineum]
MVRDTIQLEDVVSTISLEYQREFASEYYIPEDLHPEMPGPKDTIVDFPEGKVDMDLFNLISTPNPTKVKTGTRSRAAYKVPLLTANANRVIDMEDTVAALRSLETSSVVEKSPLEFSSEDPPRMITGRGKTEDQVPAVVSQEAPSTENAATKEVVPELNLEKEATTMGPLVNKRRRKRDQSETEANAPPKVLRKDHASVCPMQNNHGGKSLAAMGLGADPPPSYTSAMKDTPVALQSVSDLDPLLYAKPQPIPKQDIAQSSKKAAVAEDLDSEKSTSFTSMGRSPGSIYQPGWGVTNNCRLDTPDVCQDIVDHIVPPGYFSVLHHLPNDDFLSQYNINLAQQVAMGSQLRLREKDIKNLEALLEVKADMKEAAKAKNAELVKELESLRVQFSDIQVSNNQLSQQVSTLQAQVTGEERIKAAFEEFKKHEDDQLNSRCAEMDARLDALSIDFDEELYPHMLTAITSRRWVIGHGLRLAVMKIAKGMSAGLKHGVEHGKAKLELAAIKPYDPEANTKYVAALHALKALKYPIVDQLEKLKDAPIDLIMESLYLESNSREDTPQWIHELRPSSSQLKIPVYPEARNPKDPWSFKEEILLECHRGYICRRVEKKKVLGGVPVPIRSFGSAHHARSDGVSVSVPIAAPQGLSILLADAATHTEISEDEASPRLLRSKSLPPMYNLDWP